MKRSLFALLSVLFISLFLLGNSRSAMAHCQIPCGIYGDEARFTMMKEHLTTIEKSMKQIKKHKRGNLNQVVRWVKNKEEHADELSQIITYYFMAQRLKPLDSKATMEASKKYNQQLTSLHHMLVTTMKTKQTTDTMHIKKLRQLIDEFEMVYLGKESHAAHGH